MLTFFRLVRILLFPFIRYIVPLISKKISARVDFELQNWTNIPLLKQADFGFEVSSEGELEQIKVVLLYVLEQGKTVELLFCSPSVESQCMELQARYPQQLRLYRYPIFCYNPFSDVANPLKWLTCKTLIMCRYDFFPELIYYGQHKADKFILLAASLKNFAGKNFLVKKYLKECYQSFDQVVAINNSDKKSFIEMLELKEHAIELYDFRLVQIVNRLKQRQENLLAKLTSSLQLTKFLDQVKTKKVILGSYWRKEVVFTSKIVEQMVDQKLLLFIAPHNLDKSNLEAIKDDFQKLGVLVNHITATTTKDELEVMIQQFQDSYAVWLMDVKGILCELYSYFDLAYVGGGFGVSIHSVLEPFIAGTQVICGPKVHRSTEFTLIEENYPHLLHKVLKKDQVMRKILDLQVSDKTEAQNFVESYMTKQNNVIQWMGISKGNHATP